MIKIIDLEKEHLSEYEKKYLFTEAPDNKERVNVKRITLKAPDKRTYDFRKGADDEPEDITEPVETEEPDIVEDPGDDDLTVDDTTEEETPVEGDDTDIVTDDEEDLPTDDTMEDEPTGDEEPVEDTTGEDTGDGNEDQATVDDPENQGDDGGGDTDDIVVDDNDDINADDDQGDNAGNDAPPEEDNEGDDNNNDDTQEKIHKQNLFNRFMTLRTSIENYSTKLSSIIGIDSEKHEMIAEVSDKLKVLADMMYDYMVIKFKKNSYLESMLFYQRTVAAVNLCLDSLSKINNDPNANKKGKKK